MRPAVSARPRSAHGRGARRPDLMKRARVHVSGRSGPAVKELAAAIAAGFRRAPARASTSVGRSRALQTETMSCEVSTAVNVISETEPTGAQHPSRPHRRVRVLGTSQICYGRAPMCSQVSCAMLPQGREARHARWTEIASFGPKAVFWAESRR